MVRTVPALPDTVPALPDTVPALPDRGVLKVMVRWRGFLAHRRCARIAGHSARIAGHRARIAGHRGAHSVATVPSTGFLGLQFACGIA